jgi:hypothetical protein
VSRLFRRLQDAGLLRARGRDVEMPDLPGLARLAEPALGN